MDDGSVIATFKGGPYDGQSRVVMPDFNGNVYLSDVDGWCVRAFRIDGKWALMWSLRSKAVKR